MNNEHRTAQQDAAEFIAKANANPCHVFQPEQSLSTLDSRLRKLEDAAAWLNEPVRDDQSAALTEIRQVLLFIATQPWPRDKDVATDWASLVKHINAELAKGTPKGFRETVPVKAPVDRMTVRDLL